VNLDSPNLWDPDVQRTVDNFREKLRRWRLSFCPTCLRIHPFYQIRQTVECGHCAGQRRKGKISKYGADNDMDPGVVCSSGPMI